MTSKHKKALAASLLAMVLLAGVAYVAWPSTDDAAVPAPPTLQVSAASEPYGVFEGRVPCGGECERIKVRLTLHRDPATRAPTEYMLERIYVGQGNDRITTRGTWSAIDVPMPDRYGVAYSLDPDRRPGLHRDEYSPLDFSLYLPVGDVLLFLTPDLKPRVGDASHSFTLSRTR